MHLRNFLSPFLPDRLGECRDYRSKSTEFQDSQVTWTASYRVFGSVDGEIPLVNVSSELAFNLEVLRASPAVGKSRIFFYRNSNFGGSRSMELNARYTTVNRCNDFQQSRREEWRDLTLCSNGADSRTLEYVPLPTKLIRLL